MKLSYLVYNKSEDQPWVYKKKKDAAALQVSL